MGSLERSVAAEAVEATGNAATPLYERAVDLVLRERNTSASFVRQRLSIGFNKALSLLNRMERDGIVGPATVAGPRAVLKPTPSRYG